MSLLMNEDKQKIKDIIDKLLNHRLTKKQAEYQIIKVCDKELDFEPTVMALRAYIAKLYSLAFNNKHSHTVTLKKIQETLKGSWGYERRTQADNAKILGCTQQGIRKDGRSIEQS